MGRRASGLRRFRPVAVVRGHVRTYDTLTLAGGPVERIGPGAPRRPGPGGAIQKMPK
ncbi:protein of unknown function [Streptomyces sp. KY75]|nr:protein of unknown function [Streptomyces sp. KY70]CAD5981426.1 protein of unknown function [Streptomyces sp. KY75]